MENALFIPVSPTAVWGLQDMFAPLNNIKLGKHWPLQVARPKGLCLDRPNQCPDNLHIRFNQIDGKSAINLYCKLCGLDIHSGTHKNRIPVWDIKELNLSLARLMFVCSRRGNKVSPPIQFPCLNYIDPNDSLAADIPLLDTGFSTPDGQPIHLGLFLPHRIGGWDLEKVEWVPEEAFVNLAEASAMIIAEMINNSRALELSNKNVLGQ